MADQGSAARPVHRGTRYLGDNAMLRSPSHATTAALLARKALWAGPSVVSSPIPWTEVYRRWSSKIVQGGTTVNCSKLGVKREGSAERAKQAWQPSSGEVYWPFWANTVGVRSRIPHDLSSVHDLSCPAH